MGAGNRTKRARVTLTYFVSVAYGTAATASGAKQNCDTEEQETQAPTQLAAHLNQFPCALTSYIIQQQPPQASLRMRLLSTTSGCDGQSESRETDIIVSYFSFVIIFISHTRAARCTTLLTEFTRERQKNVRDVTVTNDTKLYQLSGRKPQLTFFFFSRRMQRRSSAILLKLLSGDKPPALGGCMTGASGAGFRPGFWFVRGSHTHESSSSGM